MTQLPELQGNYKLGLTLEPGSATITLWKQVEVDGRSRWVKMDWENAPDPIEIGEYGSHPDDLSELAEELIAQFR